MHTRAQLLDRLGQRDRTDVLVIGGGINGIGVYRDLAAQGVAALLVERNDFCGGTSAASSRLAHGGLKYLETGEFGLVRESVTERDRLLRNAPHLVEPLEVWMPLASRFGGTLGALTRFLGLGSKPRRKGSVPVRIGLMLYDRFRADPPPLPGHRMLDAKRARQAMPHLNPAIRSIAQYHDARMTQPERIGLELIADAEAACPDAMAIPYMELEGVEGDCAVLRDRIAETTHRVQPRLVINAAGPAVDRVNARLGNPTELAGGTRGSHLVLAHPALAREIGARMVYFETADHRLCLVYPLGADRLLLGTTDIPTDDPDDTHCTEAEVDYLLATLRELLPGLSVGREHVVARYAGVRPLPRSGAADPGAISRGHTIHTLEPDAARRFPGLVLVGGKWTTYRACAEEITDRALALLGGARQSDTADLAIGGGRGWPIGADPARILTRQIASDHELTNERAAVLVNRYGARAAQAAGAERERPGVPDGVVDYSEGELDWLIREERVTRAADLVFRRTPMALETDPGARAVSSITDLVGDALDWPVERRALEHRLLTEALDRHRGRGHAAGHHR